MRYLFTTDASRKQGGVQFTPVTRSGSQLFGTVQVESGADQILAAGGRWVKEISKEDFDLYETRRVEYEKTKTMFKFQDLTQSVLPKIQQAPVKAPAPAAAVVLTPSKIKAT